MRKLEEEIEEVESARSAGLPFVEPLPLAGRTVRTGGLPEPANSEPPLDPQMRPGAAALSANSTDLINLARRVGAGETPGLAVDAASAPLEPASDADLDERFAGQFGDGEFVAGIANQLKAA